MDPKAVVGILRALVEDKPPIRQVKSTDLPSDAGKALAAWVSANNIPVDDKDTEADYYEIKYDGGTLAYLADFSGDDPDQFRLTAVIQGRSVIGESKDVGS